MSAQDPPRMPRTAARAPASSASRSTATPGPLDAITDVAGRRGRLRDAGRGRRPARRRRGSGPHRRDRDPAARPRRRRRPVRRGLVLAQRQRRDDRHGLDRGGPAPSPCRSCITNTHAVGPVHAGDHRVVVAQHPDLADALAAAGGRRDLGRLPQRHQRRPRRPRADAVAALDAARGGPGRGGLGRRRHRHELLRLQGRHRHRVAAGRRRRHDVHRRRARAGQLRRAARADGRRACRSARRWPTTTRWRTSTGSAPRRRRLGASPSSPPTRRCCPGSARRSPAGCRSGWPAPARRQPLLRRPLPRVLDRQPRRAASAVPIVRARRRRARLAALRAVGRASTRSTRPSSRPSRRPCSTPWSPAPTMTGRDGHRVPGLPHEVVADVFT